jgi:hypothetical protein
MLWHVWLPVEAVAGPPNESTKPGGFEERDVQFMQAAPYSDASNITRHFGLRVDMPEYSITNESFRLLIPRAYSPPERPGLLVWISANDEPSIPADWKVELERHEMLFVSAHYSGNLRHPLDRFRLALDATCNICRQYAIDRRHIYIAGFSGGARIASMLGVAYADVFTGTLCICGVNFYRDVLIDKGKYYPATFTPDPSVLLFGKQSSRFVLLTCEHDENRQNTQNTFNAFKREGFRHVVCFEVPGMSHVMPAGKTLGEALDYLRQGQVSVR